jgi:peptidyl-prolyl cis-trans isomerase A (cyclophilin A)
MRLGMKHRFLAATLLAAIAAPAFAQTTTAAAPSVAPTPAEDLVPVTIQTSLGKIVVALDRGHAPITTANFLHYIDTHRFDGETFYRAMHQEGGGLIQGGISSDARKLFKPIAHESTAQTGLKHVTGTISMANSGPGTADAGFFILVSDIPGFDANGPGGDANGFAAFGHVTEGMDVVKAIFDAPRSPTKGEGPMKGDMLDPPIKIVKVTRVNPLPAPKPAAKKRRSR